MEQLPNDRPILAVCAEGKTSNYVAEGLRRLGFDAVNMAGGMEAWDNFYYWRTVLHFPGHTLGMVAFLIDECYLLNGDSLFIESIARPDLGGKADNWAPLLYASLKRMAELTDETVVLPAHFSDIKTGDEDGLYRATLGELKQHNPSLSKLGPKASRPSSTISCRACPNFPKPTSQSNGPMPDWPIRMSARCRSWSSGKIFVR